jgi:hypothetical protein
MNGVADRLRIIDYLVQERRALRHDGADPAALEANRKALVYWQEEVGRAAAQSALAGRPAPAR